jgi:hypothetical protein
LNGGLWGRELTVNGRVRRKDGREYMIEVHIIHTYEKVIIKPTKNMQDTHA